MKLALHRSVIFWSGIFVMTFLCWAWVASIRGSTGILYVKWSLASTKGGLSLSYIEFWPGEGKYQRYPHVGIQQPHKAKFAVSPLPSPKWFRGGGESLLLKGGWEQLATPLREAQSQREYLELKFRHEARGSWLLFIPYWLILLAFAIPWSLFLLWRARRRKGTANNQAAAARHIEPEAYR